MLLWLPLFSGNALAVSLAMQLAQDGMPQMVMEHENMGSMPCEMAGAADEHAPSCNDCELCHMACTGFLAVSETALIATLVSTRENTPYLVSSHTFTSAPLVPPPLARA